MRWIGIDEAGYGPNLGPLVMTAVVVEADDLRTREAPDIWNDLAPHVDRAGGHPDSLWVDDSKRILVGGKGRERLETTCLALLEATGGSFCDSREALRSSLRAGDEKETEWERWSDHLRVLVPWPNAEVLKAVRLAVSRSSLVPASASWRFVAARSVVLAPERFNERLDRLISKAKVHFTAFQELLEFAWELSHDGRPTFVHSDKHGGRHYYYEPLVEAFPDAWIERGEEGPELSEYRLKKDDRRLTLSLSPRADQQSGLVALASIVSKTVRELWMDDFNAFWTSRIEGLRPTAGYPVDAARFRQSIEPLARELGLPDHLWWRRK